jgi:hypothetical protein
MAGGTMSIDKPSTDGVDVSPPSALSRPDLKRTLRDLLVQDEVSDSDVEMFDKQSIVDENLDQMDDSAAVDPDMCVECGDQVTHPKAKFFELTFI